jgi:ElaB/YqjD/DUF883 family membrane-anchored ribosome-binding protein
MRKSSLSWIPFFFGTAIVLSSPLYADRDKSPTTAPSPSTEKEADLEHALAEFKAAAERLGKSMAQAAENGSTEARNKVTKTMNKAILELSHSMDKAAQKIGGSRKTEEKGSEKKME